MLANFVVLKLQCASESPGRFGKTWILGPLSQSYDSVAVGWGLNLHF